MAGQSDRWITTARALRPAGSGVTGAQVDTVARQDWVTYVDAALGADPDADPGAIATPMPSLAHLHRVGKRATAADRNELNCRMPGS